MKLRKILVVIFSITMMLGIMTITSANTANAAIDTTYWAGETFTFTTDEDKTFHISEEEVVGNLKDIQVNTEKGNVTADITTAEDNGIITFTVTPSSAGQLAISWYRYSSDQIWVKDTKYFSICPIVKVGETITIKFVGNLNETEPDENSYKDIVAFDSSLIEVIGEPVQEGEYISVTVKGKAVGETALTGKVYSTTSSTWIDLSVDEDIIITSKVKVVAQSDYLDLETGETYSDKKEIEQNYTFTQTSEEYTDVTKVKLEWEITDIAATYKSNKTWDPDNLVWVETKTVDDIADKTAKFTLTNYSSVKVVGLVSFKAEDSLKDTLTSATFDDNNGKTIDTVVNADYTIDEEKKKNVPSNVITATLKFNKDEFANLSQTSSSAKYGTYTVTIGKATSLISFTEVSYNAMDISIVQNDIVLEGSTWADVVENNKDNTIVIKLGTTEATFNIIISDKGYVLLKHDSSPSVLYLFTSDSSEEPALSSTIKPTDSLNGTLYFFMGR